MTDKTIREPALASSHNIRFISIALAVYMAWVAATYALEGRVDLLQKVDPIGRMVYTAVANIAIGIILAVIVLRYLVSASFLKPGSLGFRMSRVRNLMAIGGAFAGGLALFMLQNPASTEPMVILNAFLQVLPVSIAEVIVCWALIGTSFETLGMSKGKIKSVIIGAVAASVLFGLYHYAHSAPFNQTSVVLFLMLPSIATALTYFLTRNIYAAIIIQNFLGIVGVIANIPNLEPFRQPMVPVYVMAAVSVAALLTAISVILRRSMKKKVKQKKNPSLANDSEIEKTNNGDIEA
jgi:membrane protease YdiL (CAAX protease family)